MEQNFCQSCAMPLTDDVLGTNEDGSKNQEYCHYCFKNGKYTQECTMDQMIEHCAQYVVEFNKDSEVIYTREESITQMKQFFPHLKRWKNN